RIARNGIDEFYKGETAEIICDDMKRNGGLLSLEDLANIEVTYVDPLFGSYRGLDISTSPPPSSGITMLQILHIMQHVDLSGITHGSYEHLQLVSEATRWAVIDKDR